MKITAVTTIAQHHMGAALHIKNLRWALGDAARIVVNCFGDHRLPELPVEYNKVKADPSKFYFFWDNISDILCDNADWYVFTEQDIICTDKINIVADCINISFDNHYLAIFDNNKQKIYPRIWEGYCKIPGDIVRHAMKNNISLGNHVSRRWDLNGIHTWYGEYIPINTYLSGDLKLHEGDIDTLFEFSLFCYLNNYKWFSTNINDYHIAIDAVHFRGIDRLCHDCPKLYEDLDDVIKKLGDVDSKLRTIYDDMIGDCALMLLLAKSHKMSQPLLKLLLNKRHRERLLAKIGLVRNSACGWMDDEEICLLNTAFGLIKAAESEEHYVC